MKKIFILTILVFVFTSCSIDWNGDKDRKIAQLSNKILELDKENTELKLQVESDIFEKNKECSGYRAKIEQLIGQDITKSVLEINYSKNLNSCIYNYFYFVDKNIWFEIHDYLTGKVIYSNFCNSETDTCLGVKEQYLDLLKSILAKQ